MLIGATGAMAATRFASNLILARILAPRDFGAMFILYAVLTAFQLLSETGTAAFMVRDEEATKPVVVNTIRTVMMIRGVVIGALVFAFAPAIAGLFGKPELTGAFRVISLAPVILGASSMRLLLTTREGRQRINEGFELSVILLNTALTLVLAIWLENYWALVIAGVTKPLLTVAGAEIFYRRIPFRPQIDGRTFARLVRFSSYIFLSSVLTLIVTQADRIIVGSRLTLETAGLYGMAMTMCAIGTTLAQKYSRRVFFPEVARSLRLGTSGDAAYYGSLKRVRYLMLVLFGGGLTFGETFFDICFDDRYLQAGTIFSVAVIGPIVKLFADPAQAFIVASGNTRAGFIRSVINLVHILIFAPTLFYLFGVMGLVWAVATLDLGAALFLNWRLVRMGVWRPEPELRSVLAVGAGAATGLAASGLVNAALHALGH